MLPRFQLLFLVSCLYFISCKEKIQSPTPDLMPLPGGEIPLYSGHKEGEGLGEKRRAWFELMHKAAPGVDWRSMDRNFRIDVSEKRNSRRLKTQEPFAGGLIDGEWIERGSLNQAGSVVAVEYKPDTDELYTISAGGTLWKSKLDGSNWKPLNEDLRFENRLLALTQSPTGNRILSCMGKQVYYSDDDGASWTMSGGVNFSSDWGLPIDMKVNSQGDIYYLSFTWDDVDGISEIWLFHSGNKGLSFSKVREFTHGADFWQGRNYTRMWTSKSISDLYVVHLGNEIYKANGASLSLLTNAANLPLNKPIHMQGSSNSGTLKNLFVLSESSELYRSSDGGTSWNFVNSTNTNAWETGMAVKEWDENIMVYGEVECYRSDNAGFDWTKVNTWASYYEDIDKIHADIMDFQFFQKEDGSDFLLVSNHGGMHVSYNDGLSFTNISRFGLNVGQFYDVRTDPTNMNVVYGGSQDQGHQRMQNGNSYNLENFFQVISGDYGEMAFSRNGQSLWTNYPAIVHYYHTPKTAGVNQTWNIPGDDKSVVGWIAPTTETTDPFDNAVYVAGGNLNGGDGSHLIKLRANLNPPYTLSATQFDFDFKMNSNDSNSTISAIANSSIDSDKLYVSTSDGSFFYSNNEGINWSKTNSFTGPQEIWIIGTCILPSKQNSNTIYLGGSGYSNPAVYKSSNGGFSFSPMAIGLPNTLVYDLDANDDESLIFAGTELGPYVYVSAQNQWYPLIGEEAPLQVYNSVEFLSDKNLVRFGTYGRGMWDFIINGSCEIFSNTTNTISNDTLIQVDQSITSGSNIQPNLTATFEAGVSIILVDGFEVRANTVFEALIEECQ